MKARWLVPWALGAAACRAAEPTGLVGRGTIEIPEIDLGPPVAARVVAIRVEEGTDVAAGDTVALFSQADLPASITAGRSRVAMAQSALKDLEVGARPEELRRAEAEVAGARAEAERTAADLERFRSLFQREVVAKQQLDNAATSAAVAQERKRAAEEALGLLRAGARADRVAMAGAELATARASLGMIEARAADLVIRAPVAGRVLVRQAEPGEYLGPGATAVTLGDLARPYVRVYLSATAVSTIKLGDRAQVSVDGGAGPRVEATVVAINTRAEFTPRVALTEHERADLMFGVKLELKPTAALHPGLWVTVTFAPNSAQ